MWIAISIITGILVLLAGFLLVLSPGQPRPLLDAQSKPATGSISEKIFLEINDVRQGMIIQSKDVSQPVLLYLHGGLPEFFLTQKFPTGLENVFTVVWWDQRGAGLSYSEDIPAGSMNLNQMIEDTLAVTRYLRERFGQEKIYLMGHSGGSFIGIQAAARAPELYHAYIGVAQMTNQRKSEVLAYDYMLRQYQARGDDAMVSRLLAAPVTMETGIPGAYLLIRDDAMHRLGIGTTRDMNSVVTGVFLPSLTHPAFTLKEKVNLWRGKSKSGVAALWADMTSTDLSTKVPSLAIPAYFFSGSYDYTCNTQLAAEYFDSLQAPLKGFYRFEDSAHSPLFEEPEKARRILQSDILAGKNALADAR